ncbi:MAG TPA: hypothetical protein VL069_03915 [Opitutus sp.]|nr:hypothetical protein [Opitutus sp.]
MKRPAFLADVEFTPRKIILGVLVILGLIALTILYRQIDVQALHRRAEDLNGFMIFVLMTVLPLGGFPVSICHAIAGVRFGMAWGLLLVSVSIILQLLASYGLVKAAPKFFEEHLEPWRKRVPKGAHTPVTQFTMLVPGVPYFVQNYILPLIGVPLRPYLIWAGTIHILKSIVGIAFGHMSDDFTPLRIAGFVAYAIFITVATAFAFRRLQAQMKGPPATASDRKQPA